MGIKQIDVRWTFVFLLCTACVLSKAERDNVDEPSGVLETNKDFLVKEGYVRPNLVHRIKRRTSPGLVDVARFVDDSSSLITVYVDGTMKRLIFRVAVKRSNPVIMITTPSGVPSTAVPSIQGKASAGDTVVATVDVLINATDYGYWKFAKLDGNIWNVTIQTESPISIKQQLFEVGTNTPVSDPIVGSEYKLVVQAAGFSNVKRIILGFLFSPLKVLPITSFGPIIPKGNGKFEVAKVTMPAETFVIGLQGQDTTGHMFRRIDPTEITPSAFKLDVPFPGATMIEYTTLSIPFTVTNRLTTTQDIDVRISDPRGFSQAPTTLSKNLKPGENFTGTFIIKASFAGLSSLVKVTAFRTYGHGNFSTGPVEYRNITVVKNESTTTSTTTPSSPTTPSSSSSTTSPSSTTATSALITTSFSKPSTSNSISASNPATVLSTSNGSAVSKLASGASTTPAASASSLSSNIASSSNSTNVLHSSSGKSTTSKANSSHAQSSGSGHASSTIATSLNNSTTAAVALTSGASNVSNSITHVHGGTNGIISTPIPLNKSTGLKTGTGSSAVKTPNSNTSHDSSKHEISAGVIVAGMVSGTVIGISAIVTMAILLNKAMSKNKRQVAPADNKKDVKQEPRVTASWA